MSLIRTQGLTVHHGGVAAIENVDFEIDRGEIVTIVGPNGSGKSTLVRALLGIVEPTSGVVERQSDLRIGYLPQRLAIDASMPLTVERFLCLPHRHPGEDVSKVLTQLGVPGLENRQVTELSGGQFQRVLLARAILVKPDILILDEPTQGLDQSGAATFYRLVEQVRQELGCAVLLVSHDIHVVMGASDRVICMNGHVCCQGRPENVLETPEYRELFGASEDVLALYRHDHDHDHQQCGL